MVPGVRETDEQLRKRHVNMVHASARDPSKHMWLF